MGYELSEGFPHAGPARLRLATEPHRPRVAQHANHGSLRKHIVVTGRGVVVGDVGEHIDEERTEVINAAALAQAARAGAVSLAAVRIVVVDGGFAEAEAGRCRNE